MSSNSNGALQGKHAVAELFNISPEILDNADFLTELICSASIAAGATVCDTIYKKFIPQGVTVIALLEESHASFHTYPEVGALYLDIFTCGSRCEPEKAVDFIIMKLNCSKYSCSLISRTLDICNNGEMEIKPILDKARIP